MYYNVCCLYIYHCVPLLHVVVPVWYVVYGGTTMLLCIIINLLTIVFKLNFFSGY